MSLSMYQASIPVFIRGLTVLSGLLEKGRAHAAETGVGDGMIEARLAPDMLTLAGQVQRASDTSKLSGQRLGGPAAPAMADTEATFADLLKRTADTVAYLQTIEASHLENSENKVIELNLGPDRKIEFAGADYLLSFALPNFYFHVTTAYAILRNQGVSVGKLDFLGGRA